MSSTHHLNIPHSAHSPLPQRTLQDTKLNLNAMVKVVLITGATGGIGQATAELMASHGWTVVISGRRTVEGEKVGSPVPSLCAFDR